MPQKCSQCNSLKYGAILAGVLSSIPCAVCFCYTLAKIPQPYDGIILTASGILLALCLTETIGACIAYKWLMLPWLIVSGFIILIMALIIFAWLFVDLYAIFAAIIYSIYAYLWLTALLYFNELGREESETNPYIHKLCAPFYVFDGLYLFDMLYKTWSSARSTREIRPDNAQGNRQETVQEVRL